MTLETKIIAYARRHADSRGRVRISLESLVYGLRDAHPEDPRPTVGQVHDAVVQINSSKQLIVFWFSGHMQIRLPGA